MIILLLVLISVLIYLLWSEVPYWRHCFNVLNMYSCVLPEVKTQI